MKPTQPQSKMNRTESQYQTHLDLLKRAGEILDYRFEPMGLRLADNTFYHPDFLVVYPDHFEFHEIKGFLREDANVKFKVARQLFPWMIFKMFRKVKGGRFEQFK